MSLAVAGWCLFFCVSITAKNDAGGLLFSRLCNICAGYIPVCFTSFCLHITNQVPRKNFILKIGYLASIIFTIFGFSDFFLSVKPILIFKYYAEPGPLYYLYTFHFFFFALYSEYILLSCLKRLDVERSNQVKYIVAATVIGFSTGSVTFLPVYNIPIEPVSLHFMWIYLAVISFAIVKHGLMDIRIVLRKGVAYSVIIAVITSVYFMVVYLSSLLFQSITGYKSVPILLGAFTLIAVIFKPLERKTQDFIDRYLFNYSPDLIEKENVLLRKEVQKQDQMKAVATLAAGMAHEIKNPLTTIKTFAEFLPEKYDDPDFRATFSRIINDEVERANNIVIQLLEFAKPKDLQLKQESLAEILDDTLSLLSSNFVKSKIEVVKEYSLSTRVNVDKAQLKQAFINIVLNAVQAMPAGGTLIIKLDRWRNRQVRVSFLDTGVGIPKDKLSTIFEPFYTTKETGTGLGLSIVHGIITEHDAKIIVSSVVGVGTEVSVLFNASI